MKKLQDNSQKLLQKQRREAKKFIDSELKPFEISPVYVLIINVSFICTVFILHIYQKFFGRESILMVSLSVFVLFVSLIYAYRVSKEKEMRPAKNKTKVD